MSIITNADEVALWLEEEGAVALAKVAETTEAFGGVLLERVKQNIRGQFANTGGTYESSWQLETEVTPAFIRASVSTDHPGASRDEFGFHGTDAAGHHIDQPPRPHALPALDEVGPLWVAALAAE